MKAIIMAGGEGTRLRPLTCSKPKPMVSMMNRPVMSYIIDLLKKYNITEIGVTLQYMPEEIRSYYGDGKTLGVNLTYFVEETPLGTAGSVKNAEDFLTEDFLVISGDALTDIDLNKAIEFHQNRQSDATLVLQTVDNPLEYGVVVTADDGKIIKFIEKPAWSEVISDAANTGIYILNPKVLKLFNKGEMFDFSKDLFPVLLSRHLPMYGYVADGYWCDIGDLSAYIDCHNDILDNRVKLNFAGNMLGTGLWLGDNAVIESGAVIEPPLYIGSNTIIKNGAKILPYTVIGDNCTIGSYSTLKKSIILNNVNIGRSVEIRGAVLCDKVNAKSGCSVYENAVIGQSTDIGESSIIKPGIKIWPCKTIEDATEVNVNLIWGAKYSKFLFSDRGISGEINIDITPEFASRLGATIAAANKSKKIGLGCDETKSSEMLKASFAAGILSAGSSVYDLGNCILPATRMAVRFYGLGGAVHLTTISSEGINKLEIAVLDKYGANIIRIEERKIENLFAREDFARCDSENIGNIIKIDNYKLYFERELINFANIKTNKRIIIQTNSYLVKETLSNILSEIGVDFSFGNASMKQKGDIAAIIDDKAEELTLIDEDFTLINRDKYFLLTSLILLKTKSDRILYAPVSVSGKLEEMALHYGGKVIRTKHSPHDVMNSIILSEDIEQFRMNYDGIYGLLKILEYISRWNIELHGLVGELPKYYISKKDIEVSSDFKGRVIKSLIEENSNSKLELTEGVKVYIDGGWALVLPHNDKPMCRIITEGFSEEYAESITDIFEEKVKNIINKR